MKKLYVGNLSFSTTEATLASLFERFGPVRSCNLIKDQMTRESKGFAFVEFDDGAVADEAISQLDGAMVDGRPIKVNEARPREDRFGGGGNGGGNGGGRRFGGESESRFGGRGGNGGQRRF